MREDTGTVEQPPTGRTTHTLDARGTVRDWLVTPAWAEPVDDLGAHLDAEGDPWGERGRWRLTNGPDATPLKEELYRHRPLRTEPASGPVTEGGQVRYASPAGVVHTGTWRRAHTADDGLVDWSAFRPTPEYRVALAATVLETDQAEWRTLRLASTGPFRLFVGGRQADASGHVTYMEPAGREVRVWLPSGTTTVVVASWQVAFRECRQVVRLRVGGLPVRVVIPSEGACEYASAEAERLLNAVGVARWGTTDGTVPLVGPEGVALTVARDGGNGADDRRRVRLVGGRASLGLGAWAEATGPLTLRVSVDETGDDAEGGGGGG
ncbi:hypothetical protein, partial [Streptomyces sp. SBT349]|uniref:hypothetical protein n=1 Tax=Streptomyces sp. SBT349 TaxID=1580539 RepID=UPI00066E8C91